MVEVRMGVCESLHFIRRWGPAFEGLELRGFDTEVRWDRDEG